MFSSKELTIGVLCLLGLAAMAPGAAAVEAPVCPTTCIYDANDTGMEPGGPGPSSNATYTKAAEGFTTIPITVVGYEHVENNELEIRVLDNSSIVVGSDWYNPGLGSINIDILPHPTRNPYEIQMYSSEGNGWYRCDEFQLAEPGNPVPEFPSGMAVSAGIMGILSYIFLQRGKNDWQGP